MVVAMVTPLVLAAPAGAAPAPGITGYQVVTSAVVTAPSGSSTALYSLCPGTKIELSAGVHSHNPLMFVRTLAPTASNSWLVVVTNTAAVDDTFQTFAVCVDAASVPGFHTVTSGAVNVASPGGATGTVACASTEYALGGGVTDHNPSSYISTSRPTADSQGWQATVYNNAKLTFLDNFTVWASCVPKADAPDYSAKTASSGAFGADLTQPANGSATALFNTAGAPYCAAGQVAVGGGGANQDQTFGYISSTEPSSDGRSWLVTSTVTNPPAGTEYSYPNVVCVDGTASAVVSATNTSKIYGTTPTFGFTTTGLVNGDTLTTNPTCTSPGAAPTAGVGTYPITCSSADAGDHYALTYVGGTLTVKTATVTVTGDNQTRAYGAADPAFTFGATGLVNGDSFVTSPTCAVGVTHKNVGNYPITCHGGSAGSNYTLAFAAGNLAITPASLLIQAGSSSIVYGDNDPTIGYTPVGLVGNDTVTTPPVCGISGAHSQVGTYTVVCSGADAGANYTVSYATGTLTVAKKAGVITPDNQTITYGDADPTFGYTVSGLVNGDGLVTQPTCTVAGAHSNAGTYTITCSGADAGGNYTLDQSATATLKVNKAAASVTPDNQTITYGDADPTFGYTVSGLVNGDTLVAQPSCTVAGAHSNAGTYTITCSGADAGGNYTLDQSATATLKVNKAQLTVMANDVTRPYGVANPVLTATVGGFVAGDTAATAYSGAALVTTTAGVSSTVGTYPITAAIGTLASTNYSFAFASGTLTIVSARTTINELQVSATKTLLTGTIKFKATLVSSETGAPVVGRVVTFSFSAPYGVPGVTQCRATTDAGGVAECTTPLTLAALIEALSLKSWAVFAGDANFLGSSIQRSNQL
jgi:hypothetical protein